MQRIAQVALLATLGLLTQGAAVAQDRSGKDVLGPLAIRANCDRACLEALMNRYLDALAARLLLGDDVGPAPVQ